MKIEQAAALAAAEDRRRGREPGSGWAAGIKELLDHVAQELALEYLRLLEQAADSETATPSDEETEE